jgi:hypothetical protein
MEWFPGACIRIRGQTTTIRTNTIYEFEAKQPQLEPTRYTGDPQGLFNARPARVEPETESLLPGNPFSLTSGSAVVTVTEPGHGRSTSDTVVFRNVDGSPGGLGSNATITENAGGMTATAGPVTLTP